MISDDARLIGDPRIAEGAVIEEFVIIGTPEKGSPSATVIGEDATIRSHTVIYSGNRIGDRFQTGNKANIRGSNTIGNDVSIGTLSVIEHHVSIGDRVRIHTQVFIPEYCTLEDDVWIGPNVVLTNARYPNTRDAKENLKGVHVGKGARIGANATILPGTRIGDHSLIGAGSVIVRDTEAQGIYLGNPGRRIGWVCTCGHPLEKDMRCGDCGSGYSMDQGILKRI